MFIYLVRHGETQSDIEDRFGGEFDDSLTQRGIKQSHQLAKSLLKKNIDVIISSPKQRTLETATILNSYLNLQIYTLEDFKVRNHYGILTGLIKTEAQKRYPDLFEQVKDRHNTIPGGESYQSVIKRIKTAFKKLSKLAYQNIIVVTHGGTIRLIFREILKQGETCTDECSYAKLELRNNQLHLVESIGISQKE